MNSALIATLCGLGAAVSWGLSDPFGAKLSKDYGALRATLVAQTVGTVGYILLAILFLPINLQPSGTSLVLCIGGGATMALGLISLFKGLALGPISIVSPVSSAYPLISAILSVLFLSGHLSLRQAAGIFLTVSGVMLAAAKDIESLRVGKVKEGRFFDRGISWAFLSILFWGIAFSLLGRGIQLLGWQTATLIQITTTTLTVFIIMLFTKQRPTYKNLSSLVGRRATYGAGLFNILGIVVFNYGVTRTQSASVVTALGACYPVLSVAAAYFYFKERLSWLGISGAVLCILGVITVTV